jgi:hypothetical protein
MKLVKKCLIKFNNKWTNQITKKEVNNDLELRFTLLDMQNFAKYYLSEQLRIGGVVKPLPKERPKITSTLYPIKEKKCFWCGNKR